MRTTLLLIAVVISACERALPTAPAAPARSTTQSATGISGRHRVIVPDVREIPPPCSNPALFLKKVNPAPGYIVAYRDDVDVIAETERLQQKYGFVAGGTWTTLIKGFWAFTSLQVVAGLRCEPTVRQVEENGYFYIAP